MEEENPHKKIARDDKNFASNQISQLSRAIGFGLAAVTLVFLTSESDFAKKVVQREDVTIGLLIVSGLGCLTILFDWLQYFFGFRVSQRAFDNSEHDYEFRTDTFAYRMRWKMFRLKQVTAFIGAFGFILIIFFSIILYETNLLKNWYTH